MTLGTDSPGIGPYPGPRACRMASTMVARDGWSTVVPGVTGRGVPT